MSEQQASTVTVLATAPGDAVHHVGEVRRSLPERVLDDAARLGRGPIDLRLRVASITRRTGGLDRLGGPAC